MKNIVNQRADSPLHGRTKYCTKFVVGADLKGKTVLDIGCGFGWFELNATKKGVAKICGIDLTEEDLKTARECLNLLGGGGCLAEGSALELPFENEYFNTVVSWDVIEHIPKNTESKMMKEIDRVLGDKGIVYLSTPYCSGIGNLLDPAWYLIGHRHYTKKKMREIIEKSTNWTILSMEARGGLWEMIYMIDLYLAKWVFRRKPFFEPFFYAKMDEEYKKRRGLSTLFVKCIKN